MGEVSGETGISHLGELVRDALQVVSCPLLSLLDCKRGQLFSDAFLFLPSYHILSISTVERFLVAAVDVSLGSANIGIYLRRVHGGIAEKELSDKPSAAEGAQETTSEWS